MSRKTSQRSTSHLTQGRSTADPSSQRPWLVSILLLAFLSGFFLYLLRKDPILIGDGREYACSPVLWLKNLRPFHPISAVQACLAQVLPGDPHGPVGWLPVKGSVESVHFWLLPLLVAPFALI